MNGDDHVLHFAPQQQRANIHPRNEYVVDVLILTALKDELEGVLPRTIPSEKRVVPDMQIF